MEDPFYSWKGEHLLLRVRIQPKASQDKVVGLYQGALRIRIAASPTAGKANRHLIEFLAKELHLPASAVTLLQGKRACIKRLCCQGVDMLTLDRARQRWGI